MKYSLVGVRSDSTQSIGYNLSPELVLGRILKKKTKSGGRRYRGLEPGRIGGRRWERKEGKWERKGWEEGILRRWESFIQNPKCFLIYILVISDFWTDEKLKPTSSKN